MDFGIGIATAADSWKLAQRAEELGFTHAWFYDTQMITADPFIAMGVAATKTSRIRLGTGVLVPSNRIAAQTANCFVTLNQLAPGRIDFGVGTGFSARRAMGLGAMKLADMAEHVRVVYGLLHDEIVETDIEGKRKKIKFLNPEVGLLNIKDDVKLHRLRAEIAGAGGQARRGLDDLRCGCGRRDRGTAVHASELAGGGERALRPLRDGLGAGHRAGRGRGGGQPARDGAIGAAGGGAAASRGGPRHAGWKNTSDVPETVAAEVKGYVDLARGFAPSDARYINNHRGHFVFVKPEEQCFVTAELIRRTTFTAGEQEIKQRIEALRSAGWSQITIPITPGCEWALEDWGRIRQAFA